MGRSRSFIARLHSGFLAALLLLTAPAFAEVRYVTITDVTTRAFAVVWVSDQPILAGTTVRVFNDVDGFDEITSSLTVTLLRVDEPPAMVSGIAKVDVVGLAADTTVYVQTITVGDSSPSPVVFPDLGSLLELRTALGVLALFRR